MTSTIGIIGCGLIGETHAEALAELGNPATLYVDFNKSRASALAKKFGGRAVESPSEILHSDLIEAVYICTHHDSHASLATQAAKHGKHIFIEKPLALTEREAFEVVVAVEHSSVICMSGFKLRFYPLVAEASKLIPKPTVIVATILDRRWPDDSWANDPEIGGGNVLSQGCHGVDLVCEFANAKPIRVIAEGGNEHHPGLRITDTLAMTLTFANGTIANLTIADAGESPVTGKFSFQLMDGERSLHLFDRLKELSFTDGTQTLQRKESEEVGFLEENRAFLTALQTRTRPKSDHFAGLRATAILERAITSARTHQPQSLEDLP